MKEAWTKERLKQYCKFITAKDIKIVFKKLRTYSAWVYRTRIGYKDGHRNHPVYSYKIVFDPGSIKKVIIWHECGHIVYGFTSPSVHDEVGATMWSILSTLQRGYYQLSIDMVNDLDDPGWNKNEMYQVAREKIRKQVEYYGFKL